MRNVAKISIDVVITTEGACITALELGDPKLTIARKLGSSLQRQAALEWDEVGVLSRIGSGEKTAGEASPALMKTLREFLETS